MYSGLWADEGSKGFFFLFLYVHNFQDCQKPKITVISLT